MINKLKTGKAWCWKVAIFLPLLALLLIFCGRKVSSVPSDQNKQANQLDTIIHGKRLFVKDTTQYASSFIKELKDSWVGYETLLVKDDSFLITSRSSTGKKDTVVSYQYTIPTNLELNKEIVFSTKNKDKYLVLKRTNYTNIEYQVKNEKKEKIKSGTAILQSTFYFGAEMDHDENGQEIASIQYLNLNSDLDWAAITIELYDAKIASINYCVDPKTKKYERLSQLLRVPFDQNKNIPPPTVINIDIKKEGVYLKENLVTLDEFRKQLPLVVKNYPQSNILVNIIDKNNPDIQAIQNILKETGVAFGKPGENDRSSVASNLPTEQPRVLRQLKLIKPQTKVAASRAITLILDKDNSVYYYEGAPDKKTGIDPVVTKTDLKGIRRYLTKKNKDIISEVQQLRKKKEVFNLSENDFEKQRKEIISGKTALLVVVKSTNATQENISTILDEMERYQFYHYALFDVTDYDRSLMTNARIELNPPVFSLKKQK